MHYFELFSGAYVDVKHPYTSHFPSSNRGIWQNNQVYPSPSPISNMQQKQAIEIEKNVVITTTPPCNVSIFYHYKIYHDNSIILFPQTSHEQKDVSPSSKDTGKINQQGDKHIVHEKEISQNKQSTLKNETPKFNHIQTKQTKGVPLNNAIFITKLDCD